MERIRAHSFAKLNLRLKVTGRVEAKNSPFFGYHTLSMLNVPLELSDQIEVGLAPSLRGIQISVSGPRGGGVPTDYRNLVAKALERLFQEAGERLGVTVHLEKHVPAGAGCGGGSGNAATVLRIVNSSLQAPLSETRLAKIALGVGADVPYFLQVAPAWVGGIGDEVHYDTAPTYLRGLGCLLFTGLPPLSTPEVYRSLKSAPGEFLPDPITGFPKSYKQLLSLIENDLEKSASALCPGLQPLLYELRHSFGATRAGLTGSGSALFVLASEEGRFLEGELSQAEELGRRFGVQLVRTRISW